MRRLILSLCLIVALSPPGLAAAEVLDTSIETVRFGVCLSLSGEFRDAGRKALAGVMLKINYLNTLAIENGIRYELVVRDDKSDGQTAADIVRDLAVNENIHAIIGPLSSNLMLKMRENAAKYKVVVLSPSVTNPTIGKNEDWVFSILFDDEFQGVALARLLREKLSVDKAAAIMNRRLMYSHSVFEAFKNHFTQNGGTLVAEEWYEWVADEDKAYDFGAILARASAANPQVILLPVNSVEVAEILRQSLRHGVHATFCGGDTWMHESILLSAGNNLEGAYFVSGINYRARTYEMLTYQQLYDRSNDPYAQLSSVLGYDAATLLVECLKRGRAGEEIREGLYAMKNFPLATGAITIDRQSGTLKPAYIHHVTKEDGEFVAEIIDEIRP